MNYEFIDSDWFSQNIPLWQQHLAELVGRPRVQALEIGSFEGRSAIWLLQNVLTHPESHITCVDQFAMDDEFLEIKQVMNLPIPDDIDIEARFERNIRTAGVERKVTKMKGASTAMLRRIPLDSMHLVYVDGSHTTRNVLTDAVLAFDLMTVGGLMIFDDYRWVIYHDDERKNPGMGIDAFLNCFEGEYVVVHKDRQVIIRKTPNRRRAK
jgi:predicted O-methyltransferase YrrM